MTIEIAGPDAVPDDVHRAHLDGPTVRTALRFLEAVNAEDWDTVHDLATPNVTGSHVVLVDVLAPWLLLIDHDRLGVVTPVVLYALDLEVVKFFDIGPPANTTDLLVVGLRYADGAWKVEGLEEAVQGDR